MPAVAALVSIAACAIAESRSLVAYRAEPSPAVRASTRCTPRARGDSPARWRCTRRSCGRSKLRRCGVAPQLPSPPRLEWLELAKYWKSGDASAVWFLADPMRSDLALIDPASRRESNEFTWPLVARPAFGGMRPSAVPSGTGCRCRAGSPKKGGALTPETSGMSGLMGSGPHLAPITAMVQSPPAARARC